MMLKGWIVNLRRMRGNDLSYVLKWWQDATLMRYYDRLSIHSAVESSNELERSLKALDRIDFVVENKGGEPIGLTSLKEINWKDRHCELHIMIGEPRKRILFFGAEAGFLLLQYSFQKLNMHKVYGRVMAYAQEAERLMKTIGFMKEAVLKDITYQNGQYRDVHIFGLLDREYKASLKKSIAKRFLNASQKNRLAGDRTNMLQRTPPVCFVEDRIDIAGRHTDG
jgi:RimJ/RimL family protein N-acetyltransferase